MSLNIKNPEAHKLAQQLADMTGETLTGAVTVALQERMARLRTEDAADLSERLLEIGRDCARRLREPNLSADHAELLYDDDGLPK